MRAIATSTVLGHVIHGCLGRSQVGGATAVRLGALMEVHQAEHSSRGVYNATATPAVAGGLQRQHDEACCHA